MDYVGIMGLFNKFKKKEKGDWKNAYMGNPNFYKGKDGKPFGAFALTENTLTSLPKNPKALYKIDDTEVDEWKLMLVSTTNNGVLGDIDYYKAINKLMKFVIDEKDNNILIRGLSLKELNEVLK